MPCQLATESPAAGRRADASLLAPASRLLGVVPIAIRNALHHRSGELATADIRVGPSRDTGNRQGASGCSPPRRWRIGNRAARRLEVVHAGRGRGACPW